MQHVAFRDDAAAAAAADGSVEPTAIYTFRLDGSHSAPICDAGSCESKPRAEEPRRRAPTTTLLARPRDSSHRKLQEQDMTSK